MVFCGAVRGQGSLIVFLLVLNEVWWIVCDGRCDYFGDLVGYWRTPRRLVNFVAHVA